MKILGIDSSASAASVAVIENNKVLGEAYTNVGLTHSQTLMPMVESVLESTKINVNEIDGFAVTNGPGSFTGVRIGVSAIKGLALTGDKPCAEISTLSAIAYGIIGTECTVCAVMDARCEQVYTATFKISANEMQRLTEDEALKIDELFEKLKEYKGRIILAGDGAELCYKSFCDRLENIEIAPIHLRYQRASSAAILALNEFENGNVVSSAELRPKYLRLPQAERELRKKMQEE